MWTNDSDTASFVTQMYKLLLFSAIATVSHKPERVTTDMQAAYPRAIRHVLVRPYCIGPIRTFTTVSNKTIPSPIMTEPG